MSAPRDRLTALRAPTPPRSPRRTDSARAPGGAQAKRQSTPFSCTHVTTRADGERIFSLEGGGFGSGGMTETELRAILETFEGSSLGATLRRALDVIRAALED